jgi:cyclophilin family peptidyl-prolyl cis-trans isomerase
MMKKIILPLIIVVVAIVAFFLFKKAPPVQAPIEENTTQTSPVQNEIKEEIITEPTPTTSASQETLNPNKPLDLSQYKTPIMLVDQKKSYVAKMKTTAGEMDIELNVKDTPITANNFVFLSKKNFYDNVIFHRVIKGFMIQGGDPTGTGSGGPGYQFNDEPFKGEYVKGTVAMANSGPNTNGSQFFIMHDDYPLPPQYVIFGKVIKGLDVVDKIAEAPTTLGGDGAMSKPVTPVKILSVEIVEK